MKICYINPTNNMRRPIAELAEILAGEGYDITIIYPVSKDCPTKNWVANERIEKGRIRRIPIPSWYFAPLRYSFPNIFRLWKEIKNAYCYCDKIHIWEYYYPLSVVALLYALIKGKKSRKKIILTTDGFVGYSYKPQQPRWLVPAFQVYTRCFARFLFKIPTTMTTYGKAMLPYAEKAGVSMAKLKIIPTGIHLQRFQKIDEQKVKMLKQEFKLSIEQKKDEKVILFIGMLTQRKGIDKVIAVGTRLLDYGKKVRVLIVGDAHGKNIYQEMVPEQYKDKIIFTGGRTEIPELMSMADLLLLPSEGEGLPGVVMEAMAAGLVVVATKEGCTPDLIDHEVNGLLVDNNDYYSAVLRLLDTNTAKKMRENARQKIELFLWDVIAEKYKDLYNRSS